MDNLVHFVCRWEHGDINYGYLCGLGRSRKYGWLGGAHPDWHAAVEAAEDSEVEGILLPGLGDVGLERPRDVCNDERVASTEVGVHAELLLDMRKGGVLPQAGCDLSAVFDRKQVKVAVALLEHEVVCLPYLFRGGTEGKPGVGEARIGEGRIGAAGVAVSFGFGVLDVGGDGGAPGRIGGRHFGRSK